MIWNPPTITIMIPPNSAMRAQAVDPERARTGVVLRKVSDMTDATFPLSARRRDRTPREVVDRCGDIRPDHRYPLLGGGDFDPGAVPDPQPDVDRPGTAPARSVPGQCALAADRFQDAQRKGPGHVPAHYKNVLVPNGRHRKRPVPAQGGPDRPVVTADPQRGPEGVAGALEPPPAAPGRHAAIEQQDEEGAEGERDQHVATPSM